MSFNVCDKNGRHIGYIIKRYPFWYNAYMTAISDFKIGKEQLDIDKIYDALVSIYGCKSILGKTNHEKFDNCIDNLKNDKYIRYKNLSNEDFLKFLILKADVDLSKYIKYDEDIDIKGYILIDIDNVNIEDGNIKLDDEIDYIDDEILNLGEPVFAKIIDYPVNSINNMSIGEGFLLGADLSDLGGRNHTHSINMKLISGNFKFDIDFPINMYAQKGMPINIYLSGSKITAAVCNGIIYQVN